jgi:hypothetical protein
VLLLCLLPRLQLGHLHLRLRQLMPGSQAAGCSQAVKIVQQTIHTHGMRQAIGRLLHGVLLLEHQTLLLAVLRLLHQQVLLQC